MTLTTTHSNMSVVGSISRQGASRIPVVLRRRRPALRMRGRWLADTPLR